jgi:N6-L-threonylcarbamoyladenine synthase
MQALVLDLRYNPGGLLSSAVDVSGLFLPQGTKVVSTEGRLPGREYRTAARGGKTRTYPIAVLVNYASASGSEVVAGALKDLNRAIIVGETTFGKGSVQSVISLPDGSALRLTTAKYFTPGRQVIHEVGVSPNIRIGLTQQQEFDLLDSRRDPEAGGTRKVSVDGDPHWRGAGYPSRDSHFCRKTPGSKEECRRKGFLSRVILAIETSCDETSAAILGGFQSVLAHRVASQSAPSMRHMAGYPEVASRNHLALLPIWFEKRFATPDAPFQIDAFAATTGLGLAAALLVGASAARGLALGAGKPYFAVNHLEGHLLSPFFGDSEIPSHVALIVSGGHTLLFDVERYGQYRLLGRTLDDAAGEAFDKTAKLLGLGYPGGSEIDRLASRGIPHRFAFPRSMISSGDFNFSFSGLKTSARYFLESGCKPEDLPDICASFEEAIIDALATKLGRAARGCRRSSAVA